jgi:hypothetical protein
VRVIVAVYEVEARNTDGLPLQAIVAVYSLVSANVETGVPPCAGIVTPEIVGLTICILGLLLPLIIIFGAVYAGNPVEQDTPEVVLKRDEEVQPAGKTDGCGVTQDLPVTVLNIEPEVQPSVDVIGILAHDLPVIVLKPRDEVQPVGCEAEAAPSTGEVPLIRLRVFFPALPSGVSLLAAWKSLTPASVFGPNEPSGVPVL